MKITACIAIVSFFVACRTFRYDYVDFQGTYKQKGNSNVRLIFKNNEFANVDPPGYGVALFTCCDTIAYGNWGIDKSRGLIYLNSPEYLNASLVHLEVNEKISNKDSLTFIINNPIEKAFERDRDNKREVYYKIFISNAAGSFITDSFHKKYDNNIITVKKPHDNIIKLSIAVFLKSDYQGRNISTREVDSFDYTVKNGNSNLFEINMPELNYGYFTYLKLEKELIKIISKNELEWGGKIYLKSK